MRDPRTVLNAGAGSKQIKMPAHYRGWNQVYLDINPDSEADIIADLRAMPQVADDTYDAVFLSHVLEHFHPWEGQAVLAELTRVLKLGGFLEVRVPHARAVMEEILDGHAMDEPLYHADIGPVTPHDILYGHASTVRDGNAFMMHKVSFTPDLLGAELRAAGLKIELLCPTGGLKYELCAIGRKVGEEELRLAEAREAEGQSPLVM